MRTPIMAGNWKMYKNVDEAAELAQAIKSAAADTTGVDIVLCPPFTALTTVAAAVKGSSIEVGAQNMYWEEQGAFTGEVSPLMLQGWCRYVILGHSERREYFGETDEGVNKKAKAALAYNLIPIICCGENLAQNEAGQTADFVGSQIRGALDGLTNEQVAQVVIAYEPIWAIGTGKAAEPAAVNSLIGLSIRGVIADVFGETAAQAVRIQYGGSVKPENVESFLVQPNIDGALVGGASLKADSFIALVNAAAK
jgi:triosephosphate isomerase